MAPHLPMSAPHPEVTLVGLRRKNSDTRSHGGIAEKDLDSRILPVLTPPWPEASGLILSNLFIPGWEGHNENTDLESDKAWFKSQPCFLLIVEPRASHFTLMCGAIL